VIDEKKAKILQDEDFVDCPKFKNSIKKIKEKNPDGIDDKLIAEILLLTPEELEALYLNSLQKIRKHLDI
jgi:hypothetical protein